MGVDLRKLPSADSRDAEVPRFKCASPRVAPRLAAVLLAVVMGAYAQSGGELRFCIRADPKTLDPLLAEEEVSQTIGYLTSGVLIRFNRRMQRLEPELSTSWKVANNGRRIDFELRRDVRFSDGGPFGPADVIATIRRMMTPDSC